MGLPQNKLAGSPPLQAAVICAKWSGLRFKTEPRLVDGIDRELGSAASAGFEQLQRGVQEFGMSCQPRLRKTFAQEEACLPRSFGTFAVEACSSRTILDMPKSCPIMHDVGVKYLALGPGTTSLALSSSASNHSVCSASREYGLPASSIRQVLEELGKLSPSSTLAKPTWPAARGIRCPFHGTRRRNRAGSSARE